MARLNSGTRIYGNATIDTFATISGNLNTVGGNVNIASGGTVTAVTKTAAGTAYTSIPTVAISAPTTFGGVQATATAGMTFYGTSPTINNGGTGYTVNDVLTVVGGTPSSSAGTLIVTAVSGGVITGVNHNAFNNYTALPTVPYSVTGGTGSSATFTSTWQVNSFTITNAGTGYVAQPTVTFSGGGGSGAAAYATVGAIPKVQALGNSLSVYTPTGEQMRVADRSGVTATSTRYVQVSGGVNGVTAPAVGTGGGSEAFDIYASGGFGIYLATNGIRTATQVAIAHTVNAVNYVNLTGAATDGVVAITSAGTSANVGMSIASKGTSQLYLASGSTGGAVRISSSGAEQVVISGPSTTQNKINLTGAANSGTPFINMSSTFDTDVSFNISTKGAGNIGFWTNDINAGTGNLQARIAHTANAVNYLQFTGSAANTGVTISAQGTSANVDVVVTPKGTANTTTSRPIIVTYAPATAVGYGLQVNAANTQGGTGYADFLKVTNTSTGATNPNKSFRLSSAGAIEFINSAYNSTILSLSDTGGFSVPGPISISGKQAVNGPAFSAYANATLQTITSGSQQKVLFQTEEFDTNSNFASSRFTPTVEGYYQLNSEVRLDGATSTGEIMIVLYKNGTEYKRGTNQSGTQIASNFWAMQVSSLAYANGSTDYFEIYVQQTSGGSITVTAVNNPAITWFNGCMLRGA